MTDYHEPENELSQHVRNCTRALHSLREEVDAIDWYNQRVAVTKDEPLKKLLIHNRDEEIEHACMTLEWLRRNMKGWEERLKTCLYKEGDITEEEEESTERDTTDLHIRTLK